MAGARSAPLAWYSAAVDTTTGPHVASDAATRDAVPEPESGPGRLVPRKHALGGVGPRVGLVPLHPSLGAALVHFAPGAATAPIIG